MLTGGGDMRTELGKTDVATDKSPNMNECHKGHLFLSWKFARPDHFCSPLRQREADAFLSIF